MCGRYTAKNPVLIGEMCFEEFDVRWTRQPARFNVAPSQLLLIIALADGKPAAKEMKWGLVPFWDKSEKPKIAPINAKSEEAIAKPMFKNSLQKRRCLVPADGFYEWQKLDGDRKQPFHIQLKGGKPFFFAGIFETGENRPDSFALLTTSPNELMKPIHSRMPVILSRDASKRWLSSDPVTADDMSHICAPYPATEMEAWNVSTLVNAPVNDRPECVEKL